MESTQTVSAPASTAWEIGVLFTTPLAELPGGATGELLHPSGTEAECFAEHAVVRARGVADAGVRCDGVGGQGGLVCDPRAGEGEHDGAAGEQVLVGQSVASPLGEHQQSDGGPSHPVAPGVGEHAHEDLVGVEGAQHAATSVQECDELAVGERIDRRHVLQVRVHAVEQRLREPGEGGPETADAPGRLQPAQCGQRVQPVEQGPLRHDLPGELQVDGDVAVDRHHDLRALELGVLGGAGKEHGVADALA